MSNFLRKETHSRVTTTYLLDKGNNHPSSKYTNSSTRLPKQAYTLGMNGHYYP